MITVLGWFAAAALLLAYGLNIKGRLPAVGLPYLLLNLFGAFGLGLSTAGAHAWPSAMVNLIWLGLGIGPLVHAAREGRAAHRPRSRRGPVSPRAVAGASRTAADAT
ncbi:MAG: hypothetical protein ABI232_07815 [Jatrophihabitantaceae bacterium]